MSFVFACLPSPVIHCSEFIPASIACFLSQAIKKREQTEEPKTDDEETVEDVHDGELHLKYLVVNSAQPFISCY